MYGLSSFFFGEQRVAAELGPMMRAVPDEDMRIFLCTQIADEARHVRVLRPLLLARSACSSPTTSQGASRRPRAHLNPDFCALFDGSSRARRPPRTEPDDLEALVEAVTIYHMVIEGMLALTGQHFIIDYNEPVGTLPGFVEGFTIVARDEHRHVAFGARFLREMAQRGSGDTSDPADPGRGRCRSPRASCAPSGGRGVGDDEPLFGAVHRRDAGVRRPGTLTADEGHRPDRRVTLRLARTCGWGGSSGSRTSRRRASRPGS